MDVFSHGFWGAIAFGKQGNPLLAAAFGMAPDIIPFGPNLIIRMARGRFFKGKSQLAYFPTWVLKTYTITHSLVVYAAIYIFLKLLFGNEVAYSSLAWPLHILFDIPTHAKGFFATKFLYPLSDFQINGIPWANVRILLGNYLLLAIIYFLYFR